MAIVTVPPFHYPAKQDDGANTPSTFGSYTLNASGEKCAIILRAPKTGNIRKVGFRYTTLTTPTDTEHRIETVSAQFPSGTLLGTNTTGTIASGTLSAGAMNMVTLTADAAVTANDLIALVCAPSGSPNIVVARTFVAFDNLPYSVHYDAGAWAVTSNGALIAAVEYSDGTYAYTPTMCPVSGTNAHTYNSSSTPDEIGAKFRLPISMRVSGAWLAIDLDNDCTVVLYESDGVTPLLTSSTITNAGRGNTAGRAGYSVYFSSSATLQANTYYYLSVKPGASNISLYSWDMLSAAALDQLPGGQDWHYVSAKDPSGTGSWTATTTRYPIMGLLIDGIDDGAAAKPNIFDSAIIRAVQV